MSQQNTGPDTAPVALTHLRERAIERRDNMTTGAAPAALVPTTFSEAQQFAIALAESPLMPAALQKNAANVLVVVLAGIEMGMAPMQSIRLHHVIEGVPRLSAAAIAGIVIASKLCEYLRCTESTETRSTWVTKRLGEPERSCTWTIERAKQAGLVRKTQRGDDGMWMKYPTNMLNARARKELCEMVYPDICAGLVSQEEAEDMAADKERTAPPVFVAPVGPPPGVPEPPAEKPKRGSRAAPIDAQATERPTPPASASNPSSPPSSPTASASTGSTASSKPSSNSSKLDEAKAKVEAKRDPSPAAPATSSGSPAKPSDGGDAQPSSGAAEALQQMGEDPEPGSDDDEDDNERRRNEDVRPGENVTEPDEFDPEPEHTIPKFHAWLASLKDKASMATEAKPWVNWSKEQFTDGSKELADIRAAYARRKAELP